MKSILQKIPVWVQWAVLVILGAIMMMWPAIYNGYPLVFSDTGAYVNASFSFYPPIDRAMGYGIFIRLTSMGISLWGVVVGQALLMMYLIIRSTQLFASKIPPYLVGLIVVGLAVFTPAPWFVSQIMMDIFAPIMILAAALFIFAKVNIWERVALGALVVLSLTMHTAHPLILLFTMAVTALLAFRVFSSAKEVVGWYKRMAVASILLVVTTIGMMSMNFWAFQQFTLNPSGHVFLMARLSETPLLKDYLEKNCVENEWTICGTLLELPYKNVEDFLWQKGSIVNRVGWLESKKEYDHVIAGVLSDPGALGYFVFDSLNKGAHLLTFFTLDSFYPQKGDSPVYDRVKKFFPQEIHSYISTRQFHDRLTLLPATEMIHFLVFLLSCVGLIYTAIKGFGAKARPFVVMLVFGVIVNAFIMGGLSGVFGRYQARICWLVVLVALTGYLTLGRKNLKD